MKKNIEILINNEQIDYILDSLSWELGSNDLIFSMLLTNKIDTKVRTWISNEVENLFESDLFPGETYKMVVSDTDVWRGDTYKVVTVKIALNAIRRPFYENIRSIQF